ncbi:MAG: hypothetical protein ABIB97_02535 [Patescibacteria group bacterium]
MEDTFKVKDKIPVRKEDGTFSILESNGTEEVVQKPEMPQPAPPPPPPPPRPQSQPPAPPITDRPVESPPPPPSKPPQPRPVPPLQPTIEEKPVYKPPIREDQKSDVNGSADFQFSKDDAEEVRGHEEKLKSFGSADFVTDGERVTTEIVSANNLTFDDEIYRKRLVAIVNSRLKDIRDFLETKDMLSRPIKVGGMGYEQTLTQKILDTIEAEATKLHGHPLAKVHTKKKVAPPAVKPILPKEIRQSKPKAPVPESTAPKIADAPKPIQPKVVSQPIRRTVPMRAPTKPTVISSIPQVKRPIVEGERPKIEDIKKLPKVMSPIDEIREMDLGDFRRLGTDARGRVNKLIEKLEILEEESYAKKAQGKDAWKKSRIYMLYLEIGQQSMVQAKPIEEIVAVRAQQNLPTINFDEFEAIADFNKTLRF